MLRRIEANASVFLSTGLIGYIIFYFLLFEAIAAFWTVLYLFILPEGASDPKYVNSVLILNILVGFIFFIYLRESTEGFTSSTQQCCVLLEYISVMCTRIFDNINVHTLFIDDNSEQEAIKDTYSMIKDCNILLLYSSYLIFNPAFSDTEPFSGRIKNNVYMIPRVNHQGILTRYYNIQKHTEFDSIVKVKELISVLYTVVIEMEKRGYIKEGYHLTTLEGHLKPIYDGLLSIDISQKNVVPDFIRHHNFFILFLWFMIFLPYNILVTAGWQTLLFVYPIIMFAFTGAMIIRRWIGEPFSSDRTYTFMVHEEWLQTYCKMAVEKWKQCMDNDNYGALLM